MPLEQETLSFSFFRDPTGWRQRTPLRADDLAQTPINRPYNRKPPRLERRGRRRDDPVSAASPRQILSTAYEYSELLPLNLDYSTPERYRETLDQYRNSLIDQGANLIPGGFDRDNAPSYRELFPDTRIYSTGYNQLPPFLRPPLQIPPLPNSPGMPPNQQEYCFARGTGEVSHVEILWNYVGYSQYLVAGDPDRLVEAPLNNKILYRIFFEISDNLHLFNPQNDNYVREVQPFFDCPEECISQGLDGGCFKIVEKFRPRNDFVLGFTIFYDLYVKIGGRCFLVFGSTNHESTLIDLDYRYSVPLYGYSISQFSYRLIYNPVGDYPFKKDPQPYPDPSPMAENDCCSCRRIAAMLAVQSAVEIAAVGAITVAQTKAIAAMLALLRGIPPINLNFEIPRLTLFDSLIGLDGIFDQIRRAIQNFGDETEESEQEIDLSELITRLEYLKDEVDRLRKDTKRSYNILGGDAWFSSENSLQAKLEINPEEVIRDSRQSIFPQDDGDCKGVQANSLLGVLAAMMAVDHHRSGAYRLPGKLPKTLFNEENEDQMPIPDMATLVQWLAVQMDGMMGQYPLKIKYKDASGKEQDLSVQNQSEVLAEILGILLGISTDIDISVELGMKSTVEAIKAANAAILASDYAKANSEFLGYRGKETSREVPLTITPQSKNLRDALKESKQKIGGWKFDDKEDFQDLIRRLLVGVEIVKAAFYNRFEDEERYPGERIRDERKRSNDAEDQAWSDFISNVENPPARLRRDQNAPKPDIKDVSVDKEIS